jgi:hypothetical protein
MYSFTLSLTSVLDGGGWSRPSTGRFTPRNKPYRGPGGLQGRYGQVQKKPATPGFQPRTFQPVASRYTDCAIPTRTY